MRRIVLLLLMILIESCASQKCNCDATKKKCKKLGGRCQPKGELCLGPVYEGKKYCKDHHCCLCCVPPEEPDCCNPLTCQLDGKPGVCSSYVIEARPSWEPVGKQECTDDCICYLAPCPKPNDCGPECVSEKPEFCMCMIDGYPCPKGYCSVDDDDICQHEGCTCCRDTFKQDCVTKGVLCIGAGDYCVEKLKYDVCPKGFAIVYDICFNTSSKIDCNCCKNLGCTPKGDQCSDPGAYCLDPEKSCPKKHTTSDDCFRPLVIDGIWIQSQSCKCCTPWKIIEADENKFE